MKELDPRIIDKLMKLDQRLNYPRGVGSM